MAIWRTELSVVRMTFHRELRSSVPHVPSSCCLAVILLALSASVHADHPLISDDTETQGRGHWQLELNTDHTRVRKAADRRAWEREIKGVLTYGLDDRLDVGVALPWLHLSAPDESHGHGIGDTAVLAKWRFHENGQGWSLAVAPELTQPTGSESRGRGNGRATVSMTLLSTLERGDWSWLVNIAGTWNDNRAAERKGLWAASTAVLHALAPKWTLAADVGVSRSPDPDARRERFGLFGVIYHVDDDLDIDFGWRRSLGASPRVETLGVGVTLRW